MPALKVAVPRTNVHDLADLQTRVLAGLGIRTDQLIPDSACAGPDLPLLEALPVAIYTTDAKGRITFFNRAAAALWGRRPLLGADRHCGSHRILALDGTAMPHEQSPVAVALDTGKDVADAE